MKIYLNKASENWVIDRIREEWYQYNNNNLFKNILSSDIVWVISPWTFKDIYFKFIRNKKIVYTIYHIENEEKNKIYSQLEKIDQYVNCYHTISLKTKKELERITNKKVYYIPFWIDSSIWYEIKDKANLKEKYGLSNSSYLVGSFQRDSLRKDPHLPKLIKGPDIFLENLEQLRKEIPNIEVILTGRKRNYIINELKKKNIKFYYFEMVDQVKLNELYNCLNLYIVSSRVEGGPQAIPECALTNTPIVSTDVGMAREFLNSKSIYKQGKFLKAEPDLKYLINKTEKLIIPKGFDAFNEMFNSL